MKSEVVPEKDFATAVADELVTAINEVLDEREKCAISLSGGTTPAAVYRLLGLPPRVREVDWAKVQLYWGDERFVGQDDPKSNFRMVSDTLLHQFRTEVKPEVFPIDTAHPSAAAAADSYEALLKEQGFSLEGGRTFDIVLLGIGEDGHTASVFPGQAVPTERLVFSCPHPTDGTERISLTPKILFSSQRVYFLVSGSSKQEMVSRIMSEDSLSPRDVPAAYSKQATGEVLWFLDRAAAGVL